MLKVFNVIGVIVLLLLLRKLILSLIHISEPTRH